VVDLHFFAGMTFDRTADALGVSSRTVKRDWDYTKAWLLREMKRKRKRDAKP
jgi:DNA-directed RNA polymerase specialized sigma24 family protein